MLKWLSRRAERVQYAQNLYGSIVAMTKAPALYRNLKVPDSLEKRFELLMLHMYLFLERLNLDGQDTGKLRQRLVNRFIADMEDATRQSGVGDLAVPKKMRKLSGVFSARMQEYKEATADGSGRALRTTLEYYFFDGDKDAKRQARALADYVTGLRTKLAGTAIDELAQTAPLLPNEVSV